MLKRVPCWDSQYGRRAIIWVCFQPIAPRSSGDKSMREIFLRINSLIDNTGRNLMPVPGRPFIQPHLIPANIINQLFPHYNLPQWPGNNKVSSFNLLSSWSHRKTTKLFACGCMREGGQWWNIQVSLFNTTRSCGQPAAFSRAQTW